MVKRSIILFLVLIVMFTTAVIRLSVIVNSNTAKVAEQQSYVRLNVTNSRGTVYDCNMIPITNQAYDYIAAVPPTAQGIFAVKDYNLSEGQLNRLKSGYPVAVKVDENFSSDFIRVFKVPRHYSDKQLAPHIVGYLDTAQNGVLGIEKGYNEILKGGELSVLFRTDARGKVLAGVDTQVDNSEYMSAKGVVLTIDSRIQKIAEQAAEKHLKKGAVVVLENATGKIRAMVSMPSFSYQSIEESLKSDSSPFINRAITGYNTGSVFKLLVAATAAENNININYTCTGSIKIGDIKFSCLKKDGHGKMNLDTALRMSCNTYFINIGQKVGAQNLYSMAKAFTIGIENELSPGITADGGNLPSLSIIKQNPAALANFSFGQGDLLTTPLQIASICQTIANKGKFIKPTLIEGITDKSGIIIEKKELPSPTYILKSENADLICKYMVNVVNSGTGASAKPEINGAGGKTATAETGWVQNGKNIVQAWFAGFFPAQNPKYSIAVLAEDGITGGKSAAPVFKDIADEVNRLKD